MNNNVWFQFCLRGLFLISLVSWYASSSFLLYDAFTYVSSSLSWIISIKYFNLVLKNLVDFSIVCFQHCGRVLYIGQKFRFLKGYLKTNFSRYFLQKIDLIRCLFYVFGNLLNVISECQIAYINTFVSQAYSYMITYSLFSNLSSHTLFSFCRTQLNTIGEIPSL